MSNLQETKRAAPTWLKAGLWLCLIIAAAAVVRRLLALAHPSQSGPPQMVSLDGYFATHSLLTRAHIIPALLFVILVPIVLFGWVKAAWPQRALYVLGVIVGLTAYAMSAHAVGGWIERSAVLVFDTWFLVSLGRAFLFRRNGNPILERRWVIRAIVVLLGIATTRPVMGAFFATRRLTHLEPQQFFGIAFWIGFSINVLVVEWWLRRSRPLPPRISADRTALRTHSPQTL